MASDGLLNRAKNGTCRICKRTRSTTKHVKVVGEVNHGYATGHIWECIDTEECDREAQKRINENHMKSELIKIAMQQGRFKEYMYVS